MRTGEITAEVSEPDGDGFVWLTVCDRPPGCVSFNLGRPGDVGVDMVLRQAGLAPVRGAVAPANERLATIH
jgi:hypothetical protein